MPHKDGAADQQRSGSLKCTETAGDAALRYAAAYPVFPCKPGSKEPDTEHGFKDATTDPDVIRAWWQERPDRNVAIRTGAPGPDVLDVDVRPDGDGWAAFNRLTRAGLTTGARALVRTRSGGLHIYYAGSGQRSGSRPAHRLDFRSRGGYVIAPPSFVEADDKGPAGRYVLVRRWRGRSTFDWAAAKQVLDPPRRPPPPRTPAAWTGPDLPPSVQRALDAPVSDRSAALHRLVCACARAGLDAATIHQLAGTYPPAVDKYGGRLAAEVERSLRKIGAA